MGTSPTKAHLDRRYPVLFRQAAVESALGSQIGDVFATHWRGVTIFTALAFVLTAVLFVFIGTVEYSPAYQVPCFIDAQAGLARLNAPADGQILKLAVSESARVKKDDLLAVADALFLENVRAARAIKLFGKESVRTSV